MKVRRTFRYNISSTKVFIIHGLSIVILHFIRLLINGCLLSTSRFLAFFSFSFFSTSVQLSLSFKAALSFSSKAFSLSLFSLAFCYSACFFSRSAFFLANCSTSAILFFVDSSSSSSLPSFFFVLFPVFFFSSLPLYHLQVNTFPAVKKISSYSKMKLQLQPPITSQV